MRTSKKKGFTLTEMLIVVAIIGLGAAIASSNVTRAKQRQDLAGELRALRSAVERTRSLAAIAGSRMGTVRLAYGAGCPGAQATNYLVPPANNLLWMTIDPGAGTWTFPDGVAFNAATDTMTVTCRTETFGSAYRQNNPSFFGQFIAPAAITSIAFSQNGHLLTSPNAGQDFFVLIRHTTEPHEYGFRVLSSGVACSATDPTGLTEVCDRDKG